MIPPLRITDRLRLVHSDRPGQGKTRGMAKGPHLMDGHTVFAGEAAGFGLPVFKTSRSTVFPSLHAIGCPEKDHVEIVYDLNRVLSWHCLGKRAPAGVSDAFEKIADVYMKGPAFQQALLSFRNRLFSILRIESRMAADRSRGLCRVSFRTASERLLIRVNGEQLTNPGRLILLNEVPGTVFSRLRIDGRTLRDREIPAWVSCPFSACFENPNAGIGFSVGIAETEAPGNFLLTAGREIGPGLDWAGFALSTGRRSFACHVRFTSC